MEAPAREGRTRFAEFELNLGAGELRRRGVPVAIPEQPLRVLELLVEQAGVVVSREQLRARLWPADTFVDFEHGLNAAVKRLRDVLGDSAERPRFVETVPKRGYRFVAPVEALNASPPPAATVPETTRAQPPVRDRRWLTALMAGVLLAVGVAGAWWVSRQAATNREAARYPTIERTLTRLTFGTGLQTDVTWSPDGQRIAFASDRSGNFDIWVQPVAGGEPTQLTTSPDNDTQPSWAPDGRSIAFRSDRQGGGVFVVPALGGAARRLTMFGVHPTWMPDGRDIFIRMGLESAFARAYLVSASGDQPPREILSEFLKGGTWEWMAPHPDGRISTIGWHRTYGFGFYTVTRDGRDLTIVKPPASLLTSLSGEEVHPERHFRWSPLGNALYVEVAANQIRSLWRIPVAPTTLEWLSAERLTTGADNAESPAISPDGARMAFASHGMTSRAWVFPFDAATGRLEGEGRPITDEDTRVVFPSLSRDGRWLLYSAQPTGTDRVDTVKTDLETGVTTLLARNMRGWLESPDGARQVYLLSRQPSSGRDVAGNAKTFEFALALRDGAGFEHLIGHWSRQALMFPTDWTRDGDAVLGSYDVEFPGSGPVALALWTVAGDIREKPDRLVLHAPGRRFWQAMYSPDWRWISFVAERIDRPDTLEMGVIPASAASGDLWTRIAADHEWPDKPRWAPDGRMLYFLSRKPAGDFNLWGVHMDPRRATPVGEPFQITSFRSPGLVIDPNMGLSEMDIRGRRLLLMMRKTTGNIWMLSGVDR